MANIRQYIGARYVFKIYENSADPSSAEWESGVTYEPLTIVTYLNSTYASKKDVPGSVGNPASNPSYWVVTGAYNGQIATLQQQIDDINNTAIPSINAAIQALTNKVTKYNIIMIGDSYGTTGSGFTYFWEYFRDEMGLTEGVNFHHSFQSGAGFGNGEFLSQLVSISANISNKDAITDIFVCGGWNDSDKSQPYGTDAAFNTGVSNFDDYIKANYPNARMTLAHISWGNPEFAPIVYSQMPVSIERYRNQSGRGWRVLNGVEYILHRYNSNMWDSSSTHPGSLGHSVLGLYLPSAFKTGSCDINYMFNRTMVSADADWTATGMGCYERFINGILTISSPHELVLHSSGVTIVTDGGQSYDLIGSDFDLGRGNVSNNRISVLGRAYDGSRWYNVNYLIGYKNNLMNVSLNLVKDNGTIDHDKSFTHLIIPPFNLTLPFIDC